MLHWLSYLSPLTNHVTYILLFKIKTFGELTNFKKSIIFTFLNSVGNYLILGFLCDDLDLKMVTSFILDN